MKHTPRLLAALAASTFLAACGGGGADAGRQPPLVTQASAGAAKYSDTLLITLVGSRLDQPLTLSSPGCRNFVRSTTAPNVSNAETAFYTCTVSGVGSQTVSVAGGGLDLASVPFTVPVPQVTMVIGNGAAVTGTLVITLAPTAAPLTVDNFLAYVKSGFYNGTVFHRHARLNNLTTFALQGGGFAAPLNSAAVFPPPKATNPPIALEAGRGLLNLRYTVAMARTSAPDSATSQFFFNTVDNPGLDPGPGSAGFAVFGAVTTGTALVDAMVAAPCNASPLNFPSAADCVPQPNLVISGALQTQ
jgi:peptidyl-prolyl cis-trans isomerase A (cyclophilin A)